jgi:hypothetical protein
LAWPPKPLEVHIDVFDQLNQRAQVLPELSPAELVGAILEEFGEELDYLGSDAGKYRLRKVQTAEGLDEHKTLGELLVDGDRLVLEEQDEELPPGARRPVRPIYLQDVSSGQSFRIAWQPAIVGRSDSDLAANDLVAVDLSTAAGGSRVSRRHIKLWEEQDDYYVQAASNNPVVVVREDGTEVVVPQAPGSQRIASRELIRLDRSGLTLKFIVREA